MTTATDLNTDGCNTMKVYKHAEYYLSGKFKFVPDPNIVVVRSPNSPLTDKQREITFDKKLQMVWYPFFPMSEARTKRYSYHTRASFNQDKKT